MDGLIGWKECYDLQLITTLSKDLSLRRLGAVIDAPHGKGPSAALRTRMATQMDNSPNYGFDRDTEACRPAGYFGRPIEMSRGFM